MSVGSLQIFWIWYTKPVWMIWSDLFNLQIGHSNSEKEESYQCVMAISISKIGFRRLVIQQHRLFYGTIMVLSCPFWSLKASIFAHCNCIESKFFQISLYVFHGTKLNDMRGSKWCQNIYFWVDYTFEAQVECLSPLISDGKLQLKKDLGNIWTHEANTQQKCYLRINQDLSIRFLRKNAKNINSSYLTDIQHLYLQLKPFCLCVFTGMNK